MPYFIEKLDSSILSEDELITNLIVQYLPEVWMQVIAGLVLLLLLYRITSWLVLYGVRGLARRILQARNKKQWLELLQKHKVAKYLSNALPLFVIAGNLGLLPISAELSDVLGRMIAIVGLIYLTLTINASMACFLDIFTLSDRGRTRSINGYVEVGRIVLWALCFVIVISLIFNRSPLLMLSGLGAISAVLLLVFKDTLLSMVASTQMDSNDMLRIGDWIEMPQANADGFVVDIALHTVKIQNFDKTITTVPTYKLFSESYKNWRHMFESGGRRIKRTLRIDASSVRFLTDAEIANLRRFALLNDYLNEKEEEIERSNRSLGVIADEEVNRRRLSNIGTFRAYAMRYLKQKKGVHQDMLMMVRMMEPGSEGIPIEVYCFTDDTAWVNYEQVQGDIFDHFLSILPEMGLRLYQAPSGSDLQSAFTRSSDIMSLAKKHEGTAAKAITGFKDVDDQQGPRIS